MGGQEPVNNRNRVRSQTVTAFCTKLSYSVILSCMASTRTKTRSSRVFTISFPEKLAQQVIAVAEEENRNISELFREAFRSYRIEKGNAKLERIRAAVAARGPVKYKEEDVEALVDEIRAENFVRRKKTA